jgi:hypothetical protein
VFAGDVVDVTFLGDTLDCRIRVAGHVLVARQHPSAGLAPDERVFVELPAASCAVVKGSQTGG